MKKSHQSFSIFLLLFSLTLIPCIALSDVAPPDFFWSVTKQGHDVKILVEQDVFLGNGNLSIDRTGQTGNKTVVESATLEPENAAYMKTCWVHTLAFSWIHFCMEKPEACHKDCPGLENTDCIGPSCENCQVPTDEFMTGIPDFCAKYPEYANDCDNDGVNECCGDCEPVYFHEFLDECVPPGENNYRVTFDYLTVEQQSIVIDEHDTPCDGDAEEPNSQATTDTGVNITDDLKDASASGDDTTDESNEGGCSVVNIGTKSESHNWPVSTLLTLLFQP